MSNPDVAAGLVAATRALAESSDTPRLDAELLMAHALGIDRSTLLLQMRDLHVPNEFAALLERRLAGEPVAYIRGYQEFWDLTLAVTPAVLIPRGDSETLIDAAQRHFIDREPPQRILDMGTGSGALLLAALSLFPEARGLGIDASADALAVASGNAERLGFGVRAALRLANWRDSGWHRDLGRFDLILCNPPYVESNAELSPSVRNFEPHPALFAGPDGMDDYAIILPQIPELLTVQGTALFEIGKGQADSVNRLALRAGLTPASHTDLQGIERAIAMTACAHG